MVPGVQHHLGSLAEGKAVDEAGPPVRHVSVVEGGLEELVLQDKKLVVVERRVDLGQGVGKSVLALADGVLAGVVRSVR